MSPSEGLSVFQVLPAHRSARLLPRLGFALCSPLLRHGYPLGVLFFCVAGCVDAKRLVPIGKLVRAPGSLLVDLPPKRLRREPHLEDGRDPGSQKVQERTRHAFTGEHTRYLQPSGRSRSSDGAVGQGPRHTAGYAGRADRGPTQANREKPRLPAGSTVVYSPESQLDEIHDTSLGGGLFGWCAGACGPSIWTELGSAGCKLSSCSSSTGGCIIVLVLAATGEWPRLHLPATIGRCWGWCGTAVGSAAASGATDNAG
mmetsp:Transcript_4339/g.10750  ORF Transcript_4339/g.10750 Transcript_4339/m.10750 type:complete len:257 (-) Transcript_4339:314-1084(-)